MAFADADLFARVRPLFPEMLRFAAVGAIGAVFDLGGAALLHGKYHVGALEAKGISTVIAMVITYLLSRFWTFSGSESQDLKRQTALFVCLNLVGLIIAEAVVGFFTYMLALHSQIDYNLASFIGTGFGTIFRYFTYRKWVFPAPAGDAPVAAAAPAPQPFSGFPPWELDPAFVRPTAQAPVKAFAPVAAPVYSAPVAQGQAASQGRVLAPAMSWSAPAPQPAARPNTHRAAQDPFRALRWSGSGRHRKS